MGKKIKCCHSKITHKTKKAAMVAMYRMLKTNFIFHRLKVYECDNCGYYHVGRTKEILYDRFSDLTI